MYVDTHCHIFDEYYEDINLVLSKSKSLGAKTFINAGCDDKSNKEIIKKVSLYDNMYGAIGIHPEVSNSYTEEDLKFIESNLNNDKILAIGEIGLDYHYDDFDKTRQIELFEKQLALAEKYNIPVVIHSRDATEDTIKCLKKYNVKGIVHSFSGSKETAEIYIKMGFLLGINGVVTFKNAHIKEVIKEIGINHFVLETDSPYLTPHPFRGEKNFPGNISVIIDFLSEYLSVDKDYIINITNENVKSLFPIIK